MVKKAARSAGSRGGAVRHCVPEKVLTKDERLKLNERKRLHRVLQTRCARKNDANRDKFVNIRHKFKKLKSLDEQVAFLRENVQVAPKKGRQPGFAVCVKSMNEDSMAARRTLCLYGYVTMMGLQNDLPLPPLYQILHRGKKLEFHFCRINGDADLKKTISDALYTAARAASIKQLVDVGVDSKTISHHEANWALVKVGSLPYRAIYVGRAGLDIDKASKMIQSRLALVSCSGSRAAFDSL